MGASPQTKLKTAPKQGKEKDGKLGNKARSAKALAAGGVFKLERGEPRRRDELRAAEGKDGPKNMPSLLGSAARPSGKRDRIQIAEELFRGQGKQERRETPLTTTS